MVISFKGVINMNPTYEILAREMENNAPSSSQFPGKPELGRRKRMTPVGGPWIVGMLATLPCNTRCCGGFFKNFPSTRGSHARTKP